jgi:hypothetical protein
MKSDPSPEFKARDVTDLLYLRGYKIRKSLLNKNYKIVSPVGAVRYFADAKEFVTWGEQELDPHRGAEIASQDNNPPEI